MDGIFYMPGTVIDGQYRSNPIQESSLSMFEFGCPLGGAAVSLPSFPLTRESGGGGAVKGWSFQYRRDSRVSGNDGRGWRE